MDENDDIRESRQRRVWNADFDVVLMLYLFLVRTRESEHNIRLLLHRVCKENVALEAIKVYAPKVGFFSHLGSGDQKR